MSGGWQDLTPEQRSGMTREFWEGLKPEEQQALVQETCIEEGCRNRRWQAAGSFRCEKHTREYSGQQEEAQKLA